MTKQNVITEHDDGTVELDFYAMHVGAEEDRQQMSEQFKEKLNNLGKASDKATTELLSLTGKMMVDEFEERERQKAKDIEEAKEKAIKDIEVSYESKGIKTERTKEMDKALKSLLNNYENH